MPFDWDDIDTDVNPALLELPEFNSSAFDAGTNPHGLADGGHISQFPQALGDLAIVANAFPAFADLMEGYADAAAASETAAGVSAATLYGTSTTSLAIGTGSKAFTTQSGKQFGVGQWLMATSDAGPTASYMVGQVTAYSGTALTLNVLVTKGSGTKADWTIRQTGTPGRNVGLAYIWSTNTASSDPATGKIKFNNSTMSSITAMYISQTDFDGNSLATLMTTWDDSTSTNKARVYIHNPTAPANFLVVNITSTLTDNTGWNTFTVEYVTAGGTLANDSVVSVLVIPNANKGDTGATGASYAATSTTSLAIGTGTKAFTTQSGLAYQVGARVRATDSSNTANWMEGLVASYSSTTLTITSDLTNGSGTIASWLLNIAGEQGETGDTGSTGDDGGLEFVFNSATSGDPGTGKFLFNNATFASATTLHISETDNNANSVAALFAALDDGSGTNKTLIFSIKQGGSAYHAFYVTAALSDLGTYDTFSITPISTSGTITNADTFHLTFIPLQKGDTGSTGATGPTTAPTWLFDSGTSDADPGTNEFALNNGTIASVTKAFINSTGVGASDLTAFLDALDDSTNSTHRGTLFIVQGDDPSKFAIFTVGTVTDDGAYHDVALTYVAGPGGFTAGEACAFSFSRSGNAGAGSGDVVGPASATNNGIVLYDGTTGKLVKDSAAVGALAYKATIDDSALLDANVVTLAKLATQAAGTVLANDTGGGAVPTALAYADLKTSMAFVKGDVGLGNVDNTADASKPVSTAAQTLLDMKRIVRVRAATTTNVTIATALNNGDSLDDLTLATGELVAVMGQTSPAENGIFVVGASPARHTDLDAFADYPGLWVVVQEGTASADTVWLCTANAGGTIDSTALTFVQQGGPSTATGRSILNAADAAAVRTAADAAASGANTDITSVLLNQTGLVVKGASANPLTIKPNETLSTGRTLNVVTGDADRTITFGGNITTTGTFAMSGSFSLTLTVTGNTTLTFPTSGTLATTDASSLTSGTLPDARLSSAATAYGKQCVPVPAPAMTSRTTNGAASGTVEMTTNKNMFLTLDFDASTQEFAQFSIPMPDSWNEGTVTFRPIWSHASTTTNFGVVWSLAGVACSDDDAGDVAFGTVQTSTDTGGTTNDIYIGPESSAITIAGTPAAGDFVMFQIARVPADGSDTMAVDARLHGIKLFITTDAGHD